MEDLQIEHDTGAFRFSTTVDGFTATLDYRPVSDNVLDFSSTFVPPEIRGRGVAQRLTMHALQYAADGHFKVIPSCWFVAKVLRENPVFAELQR